jgi:DNA-binding HxlR family transcriptional regulator
VDAQTYSVLAALGPRENLELVLELLEAPRTYGVLRQQAGIPKSTASSRLNELTQAGLITRKRLRDPFEVACPAEVRRLLEAASELSLAVLAKRTEAEQQLARRVKRTRLRQESGASQEGREQA